MLSRDRIGRRAMVVAGIMLLAGMASPASAYVISTWDDGTLDGWTYANRVQGYWEVRLTGGNPFGYVRMYHANTDGVTPPDLLHAPSPFLGNLGAIGPGARFEFDIKTETPAAQGSWLVLTGPGTRAYHVTPIPTAEWSHYVLPLEPAYWTMSYGTWEDLLANVTGLGLSGDIAIGAGWAEVAYDNFALVPEPAAACLLMVGGAALLRRRRP